MRVLEKPLRRLDDWQRARVAPAFVVGVVKKFGDDSAGMLAALIAYYGFLSLFPLLLVLITILGLVFAHDASLQNRILHSTLGQFPIVGRQLAGPHGVRSLRAGSEVGLAVGLVGLLWGSQGVSQAAQRAMADVWDLARPVRPGFAARLGRSLAFLLLLGLDVVVTTLLAGFVTLGRGAPWFHLVVGLLGLAVNGALFLAGFRILTPRPVSTGALVPGAVLAGTGWTALQYAGTVLVGHVLRHANQTYGYFGSVLGLLWWLYLAARLTLYAAEVNVVHARHLYPRSLLSNDPPEGADHKFTTGEDEFQPNQTG